MNALEALEGIAPALEGRRYGDSYRLRPSDPCSFMAENAVNAPAPPSRAVEVASELVWLALLPVVASTVEDPAVGAKVIVAKEPEG